MPYQDATPSYEDATYLITVIDGEGRGLDFMAKAGNHPPSVYANVFQEIVTLLSTSQVVSVVDARRTSAAVEQVTP